MTPLTSPAGDPKPAAVSRFSTGQRADVSMADPRTARSPQIASTHPWLARWMWIVYAVGAIWAWLLLSLFYVMIIAPIGLLVRLLADPLRVRPKSASWQPFPSQYDRLEDAADQS